MTKSIIRHPLSLPLLVGFILRLVFVFVSRHIYYPDELYQSLEQAHRLIYGFGIVPWDIAYGLRSFVLPLLLAIPLSISHLLHLYDPVIYAYFSQIFLILLSLIPVAAVYYLVLRLTQNSSASEFSAFAIAIWYELIYFSSRGLTENVSVNIFSLALLLLLTRPKNSFWIGFFTLFASLLRPQYIPITIILVIVSLKTTHSIFKLTAGYILAILLFGFVDSYFLGGFLIHLQNNLKLSMLAGISEIFGIQSLWFYLKSILVTSSGLAVLSLAKLNSKSFPVLLGLLGILILHSLIPHKEYRFIIIAIPLWITLLSVSIHNFVLKHNYSWSRFSFGLIALSLGGILGIFPDEHTVYTQPLLSKNPVITIYQSLYQDTSLCGLYDSTRSWVDSPGYFYLNRRIPLYTEDYPPENPNFVSHYISTNPHLLLSGFTQVSTSETYDLYINGELHTFLSLTLYRNLNNVCVVDPKYSTFRTFPAVTDRLFKLGATPLLSSKVYKL